ncbi:sporulation histidine kinase inhibitor Sda [Bacillus taeanensis]|uniref:Sporulation histidine kinase inhibitor Sda n=1 Tax=Bacillus taeanensis TaxID=273032 RepID=A0A366XWI8_9BACI|nr:sporulation histidine kinase inhibitor Sda [Bacillus taeanensis]RBW70770.1 sporulation histidine kinase inhibitor Sda [Bacillus taeanensis]
MNNLSDSILINAYYQAMRLELNIEFIALLKSEINRRNLAIKASS